MNEIKAEIALDKQKNFNPMKTQAKRKHFFKKASYV